MDIDDYLFLPDGRPYFVCEKKQWKLAWDRHVKNRNSCKDVFEIHVAASSLERKFSGETMPDDYFALVSESKTTLGFGGAKSRFPVLVSQGETDCTKKYGISGVGQLPGADKGRRLLVPPDRNRACLGEPNVSIPIGRAARNFRESMDRSI